MSERIEKIVKMMTYSRQRDWRFTFGDIDFAFDYNCPNEKIPGKGYKNITKDEYRKAYKIFHNLLKSNLVKNLPAGTMVADYSKGTYTGNFGQTCYYYEWIE
jgi:hypothetical protein